MENKSECKSAVFCIRSIPKVLNNCITECDGNCTSVWQIVDGYHRMCAHEELSEEFDTLYDELSWDETVCDSTAIHCNVPWEEDYEADCESVTNENVLYYPLLTSFGKFDPDQSAAADTVLITAVMSVLGMITVMSGGGVVKRYHVHCVSALIFRELTHFPKFQECCKFRKTP